jgi:predicted DNA-binding protein YlxM (UPF0122 family)
MDNKQARIHEKRRLYDLYVIQELSLREIAEMFNTTKATIGSRLKKYDIEIRPRGARLKNLEIKED